MVMGDFEFPSNLFLSGGRLNFDAAIAFACNGTKEERHAKWSMLKKTLHEAVFQNLVKEAARRRAFAQSQRPAIKVNTKRKGPRKSSEGSHQATEAPTWWDNIRQRASEEFALLATEANEHVCPID